MQQPGIIIIILILYSCKDNSANENNHVNNPGPAAPKTTLVIIDSNVYNDIDLFNLEGKEQIKNPVNYPYIKIELNGDLEKKVIYKISGTDSIEKKYTLKNNYWTSVHEYKADTGYAITYEYLTPKKIIELEYLGTIQKTDYHLHSASLIEATKEIGYSYWGEKGIDITPKAENFEIVKKNTNSIYTTEFSNKNGFLRITSNYFDKKENHMFFSDTSCYKIGKHSWFWWRYLSKEKPVKCK